MLRMRVSGVVRLTAALQMFLLLGSLFLPALASAATIQTDLWVYQDGDTVTVTGVEYGANEVVDFVTTDPAGTVVETGSASSDDLGNVTYAFTLHATVEGIYDVVGTGETSGLTASTQFDPVNVSIANGAFSWKVGSFSIPLSGNYTCSSGGTACTVAVDVTIDVFPSDGTNNSVVGSPVLTKVLPVSATGNNQPWSPSLAFPGDAPIPADGKYDIRATFHGKNGVTNITPAPTAVADDRFGVNNGAPLTTLTVTAG